MVTIKCFEGEFSKVVSAVKMTSTTSYFMKIELFVSFNVIFEQPQA